MHIEAFIKTLENVNQNIFATIFGRNEAIPFDSIKPLDLTF